MPEMRRDPVTKKWTIIAAERAKRPIIPEIRPRLKEELSHEPDCFFCSGNEHKTPPETLAYRGTRGLPNTPGWNLRVVPNKFAALNFEESFHINQIAPLKVSSYAAGMSEIIIESPNHSANVALLSIKEIAYILRAYKERYISLSKENSVKYISIFKNNGMPAGAGLPHPHSQIIALPIIPTKISEEFAGANDYFESAGRCIYCDMIKMEAKEGTRIIYENDYFMAFAPYASKTPFETWILPKSHSAKYQEINEKEIFYLAEIWKAVLSKIYTGLENPPYNYYIHTSPTQKNTDRYYHWHMELIPKMTITAGFEMGTDVYINIAIPEDCADYLRNIEVTKPHSHCQ